MLKIARSILEPLYLSALRIETTCICFAIFGGITSRLRLKSTHALCGRCSPAPLEYREPSVKKHGGLVLAELQKRSRTVIDDQA